MTDFLQPAGGWAHAGSARIAPPPPKQRGLLFRAVSRASSLFGRPDVPDIFPVLHKHPMLFWTWLLFASRMMPFGKLDARERELLILRTGWNCRSRYEWGQHVDIALRVGASDEDVRRVALGPQAWGASPEHILMQACDELCTQDRIADVTWQALAQRYDERLCIEILMLIGHYRMIAGFLNSSGIALEPPTEKKLQDCYARLQRTGTGVTQSVS